VEGKRVAEKEENILMRKEDSGGINKRKAY
jgi:hypothetical protein